MNAKAASGALSVYVGDENRPAGTGACVCPPGTLYGECACPWGDMIHDLMRYGYGAEATPETLTRELPTAVRRRLELVVTEARRRAFRALCASWTGSIGDLCDRLGLAYKTVREIDSHAMRELSARQRYNSSWVNRKAA